MVIKPKALLKKQLEKYRDVLVETVEMFESIKYDANDKIEELNEVIWEIEEQINEIIIKPSTKSK